MTKENEIAAALRETLSSPAITASDMNTANIVDVVHHLAEAIDRLAKALEERSK